MRFVAVQEPTGTWAVFDEILGIPAAIADRPLIGLEQDEAELLSAKANRDAVRSMRAVRPTVRRQV
jgi:hypothetical protein